MEILKIHSFSFIISLIIIYLLHKTLNGLYPKKEKQIALIIYIIVMQLGALLCSLEKILQG
jgi:hypothetical protein